MLYRHGGVWFGDGSRRRDAPPIPGHDVAAVRARRARGRDVLCVRACGRWLRRRVQLAARDRARGTASGRRTRTKARILMRAIVVAALLLLAPARAIAENACHVVEVKFQPTTSDLQIVAWNAD